MGAWCSVGSRPDLRHRPRHRCAAATPIAVSPVATGARDIVRPRQTSRHRSADGPCKQRRDVGLRRRTTNQRRQLPTCRSSLVATRSQRVFRRGEHERLGASSGRRDAGVITLATAPRGASPRASRRWSRRTRCAGMARRRPITR